QSADHRALPSFPTRRSSDLDSWYWDSPIDPNYQYETFVSEELVKWIDKNYNTIASREGRAITGLSMGGHGGLYLGFRNLDVFGADRKSTRLNSSHVEISYAV